METPKQRLKRLRAQGRIGGLAGGPARRLKLDSARRIEIAKLGAKARWQQQEEANDGLLRKFA